MANGNGHTGEELRASFYFYHAFKKEFDKVIADGGNGSFQITTENLWGWARDCCHLEWPGSHDKSSNDWVGFVQKVNRLRNRLNVRSLHPGPEPVYNYPKFRVRPIKGHPERHNVDVGLNAALIKQADNVAKMHSISAGKEEGFDSLYRCIEGIDDPKLSRRSRQTLTQTLGALRALAKANQASALVMDDYSRGVSVRVLKRLSPNDPHAVETLKRIQEDMDKRAAKAARRDARQRAKQRGMDDNADDDE